MKTNHILILIISVLAFISCAEKQKSKLIYSSTSFNAPISCISPSSHPYTYYIGLENGDVIKKNIEDNSQVIVFRGNNNRIYDVYEECEKDNTTLWIAIRDEGLVKKQQNGQITTYSIHHPKKNSNTTTNYAPYQIASDKASGDLYFATSSGVYVLRKEQKQQLNNSILTKIYRPDPEANNPYHWGVHQILMYNNLIYCATDSGLIVLNKQKTDSICIPDTTLTKKRISHLFQKNDTVYASSNENRYIIYKNKDKKLSIDSIPIAGKNLLAYIVDSRDSKWEFLSDTVNYVSNTNEAISYKLPGKLTTGSKNYVRQGKDFILLANGKTLYLFFLHQSHQVVSDQVIAAHTTKFSENEPDKCYFITNDYELYSLETGNSIANWLCTIDKIGKEEKIIRLCSSKEFLWLLTEKRLCKINQTNSETTVITSFNNVKTPEFKSIAFIEGENTLYLGTRTFLYKLPISVDSKNMMKPEAITKIEDQDIDSSDLYVTNIFENKHKDEERIYFSTLNKGVFYLKIGNDSILKTVENSDMQTIGSVRNIANYSNSEMVFCTSKGLYSKYNHKDSIGINPISSDQIKLISAVFEKTDGFFVIGHQGIGTYNGSKIKENDMSFFDIPINKAAVAEGGKNALFIGSPVGFYKYEEGKENPLTPIVISPKPTFSEIHKLQIICISFLLLLIIGGLVIRNKKNSIKKLTEEVDGLQREISDYDNENLKLIFDNIQKKSGGSNWIFTGLSNLKKEIESVKHHIFQTRQLEEIIKKIEYTINHKISENVKKEDRLELENKGTSLIQQIKNILADNDLLETDINTIESDFFIFEKQVREHLLTTEYIIKNNIEIITDAIDAINKHKDKVKGDDNNFYNRINEIAERIKEKETLSVDISYKLLKEVNTISIGIKDEFAKHIPNKQAPNDIDAALNALKKKIKENDPQEKKISEMCDDFIRKYTTGTKGFFIEGSISSRVAVLLCIDNDIDPQDIKNVLDLERAISSYWGDLLARIRNKFTDNEIKNLYLINILFEKIQNLRRK